MFIGLGHKLAELFGNIVRFLVDEIFSAAFNFLGQAFEAAWHFVWRDTRDDLASQLLRSYFGEAPLEMQDAINRAINETPQPLKILLLINLSNALGSLYVQTGTIGTQQEIQQESLERVLNTLFNPLQAATLNRLAFLDDSAYEREMARQGYDANKANLFRQLARNYLDISVYAEEHRKGTIQRNVLEERAVRLGLSTEDVEVAFQNTRKLLTELILIDAFRRRIIDFGAFTIKMRELGYVDDDIDIAEKQAKFYPPPTDLITWVAREVYEADSVAKYGLEDELDRLDRDPFYRGGLDDEQIRNYWVAHWQHPSWTQMLEMLHRRIVNEDEVWEWFRLVEVPPFWRDKMIRAAYVPLTRVDVRRMWDVGVVTDERLVNTYLDSGYRQEDAEALLLFTKVERRLPDIISRYRNLWITKDAAFNELLALGLPANVSERIWQEKIVNLNAPLRVAAERDLTKAEIIKGYKKAIISTDEASRMLVDLGYDKNEAEYLLLINTEFTESPETPLEFRVGIEKYKKAQGLPYIEIPPELIQIEREILQLKKALSAEVGSPMPQSKRASLEADLATLEYRLMQRKKVLGL